jgi:hypothetical protein
MQTEREHARALTRQAWSAFAKKGTPSVLLAIGLFIAMKHVQHHEAAQSTSFKNASKMFGGLKNPQY